MQCPREGPTDAGDQRPARRWSHREAGGPSAERGDPPNAASSPREPLEDMVRGNKSPPERRRRHRGRQTPGGGAAPGGPRGGRPQARARHGNSLFRSADAPRDRHVSGRHCSVRCPWPAPNRGPSCLGDPGLDSASALSLP